MLNSNNLVITRPATFFYIYYNHHFVLECCKIVKKEFSNCVAWSNVVVIKFIWIKEQNSSQKYLFEVEDLTHV